MAHCELSGKGPVVKNLVSHSNIKTKSRAKPNIQSKKFYSLSLNESFHFKVSSRVIRSVDKKGGLDVFIVAQKDSVLSPKALKLKKRLIEKTKKKKKEKS